jgi:hypothetical protein
LIKNALKFLVAGGAGGHKVVGVFVVIGGCLYCIWVYFLMTISRNWQFKGLKGCNI